MNTMVSEKHRHLNCHEILGNLSAYLDGELEAKLCAEIENHLAECGDCRVVVDTLRKTILLYRELGQTPADIPQDVEQRLYRSLDLTPFL
jgi:predicted anti-sigma-YlaC factor YlaD